MADNDGISSLLRRQLEIPICHFISNGGTILLIMSGASMSCILCLWLCLDLPFAVLSRSLEDSIEVMMSIP